MFQRHVSERLAALVDGQLPAGEATRVRAHLAGCSRCRRARDEYQSAAAAMKTLPVVAAPDSIWRAIEGALDARAVPIASPRSYFSMPALALAAGVVLAVAGLVWWQTRTIQPWDVRRDDGARMAIGEWIETGGSARSRITIGSIGTVDIEPNTRLRLLAAGSDQHRLQLARGTVSAQISAPPRLFFVETPASTVVDLGCAYTMTVDESGTGTLRVTQGWASLEWEGRESIVPAGASCPTRPSVGPGTPAFDDASARLKEALLEFDFGKAGPDVVTTVLVEAGPRDTLTLWHLLSRVDASERERVFERMVTLAPLPPGVTRERALALDAETLRRWREELAWSW